MPENLRDEPIFLLFISALIILSTLTKSGALRYIGNRMGQWAVPDAVYGGLVLAAGLASIISPLTLGRLFDRWPDVPGAASRAR